MNNEEVEKRIRSIERVLASLSESYSSTTQILVQSSETFTPDQKERIIKITNDVLSMLSLLPKQK